MSSVLTEARLAGCNREVLGLSSYTKCSVGFEEPERLCYMDRAKRVGVLVESFSNSVRSSFRG